MNILYFLIPIAILLATGFVGAFFWAIKKGQYDDVDSPPQRMLND
jgi:cbb3-type cytochrome oxidase maturation protein